MLLRVNKEVNRHMRALTFDTNSVDDYAMILPIVQRILNAAYSDSTKVSASQLLFGNAINLDRGLFLRETSTGSTSISAYVKNATSTR